MWSVFYSKRNTAVGSFERSPMSGHGSCVSPWLNAQSLLLLTFSHLFWNSSYQRGLHRYFFNTINFPQARLNLHPWPLEEMFLWHVLWARWFHAKGTLSWALYHWDFFHMVIFKYSLQGCLDCCNYWWYTLGFSDLWSSILKSYWKWDR